MYRLRRVSGSGKGKASPTSVEKGQSIRRQDDIFYRKSTLMDPWPFRRGIVREEYHFYERPSGGLLLFTQGVPPTRGL